MFDIEHNTRNFCSSDDLLKVYFLVLTTKNAEDCIQFFELVRLVI